MSDTSTVVSASPLLGTSRSLDIAARSLLESEVSAGNVASVMAEGALSHHWNGLFQHAAIRVGPEAASALLADLKTWFMEMAPKAAERPAHLLYRKVHALALAQSQKPLEAEAPQWWVPPDNELAACCVGLRRALSACERDALELCHCRGLRPDEAADVLEKSLSEVEAHLASAERCAERIATAAHHRSCVTRERLLLQAFALDPRRTSAPARPARKPVLETGTVIQERYEIGALLGAGAFADVYRARDRDVTGHEVALKILRRPALEPHAVRAALRELQLIASVFHPSVVQLKDHGWFERRLWFVMPLYRGETLAQRVARSPLSRLEAKQIFEVLAEALATMHRVGVRHQDIKPENVFLANIGSKEQSEARVLPVLLDLGVAAKDVELVLAGTPAYFAPEVAARFCDMPDPPAVGPAADVFSLALTLRDALDPTPRDYFAAGAVDAYVSFRARQSPRPPWRPDLADLVPSFERWLHRKPDERPTAEEFRRELSVLTRPHERRERRSAVLRWLVPSTLAVVTLFAFVVYALSKEAAQQRTEAATAHVRATRASELAESMHASLEAEEALRRRLEREVAELEAQYNSSRLTREELAQRLASAEGEARLAVEQYDKEIERLRRQLRRSEALRGGQESQLAELEDVRKRRDELNDELNRQRIRFEEERAERRELETKYIVLEAQMKTMRRAIAATRAKIGSLLSDPDDGSAP